MALRHPRPPVARRGRGRRGATGADYAPLRQGLACLGLIVKFFVPHSGPFYRLVPRERGGVDGRERVGGVARRLGGGGGDGRGGEATANARRRPEGVPDKRRGRGIEGKYSSAPRLLIRALILVDSFLIFTRSLMRNRK